MSWDTNLSCQKRIKYQRRGTARDSSSGGSSTEETPIVEEAVAETPATEVLEETEAVEETESEASS